MSKRNRQTVQNARYEHKQEIGRLVMQDTVKTPVKPMNDRQRAMQEAIRNGQIVVLDAPAGVGKSFITMSELTDLLKKGVYNRLILTRPSVGMGNTIGLLKGDLREKFEMYIAPLIEVIKSRYGKGFYEASLGNGMIEMLPVEYARGKSIDCLFVVDEAQNTTPNEMYSLVTRLADGGKLIILGDRTQKDIQGESGIEWLLKFVDRHNLKHMVRVVNATSDDIVRGDVCKAFVKAKEIDRASEIKYL